MEVTENVAVMCHDEELGCTKSLDSHDDSSSSSSRRSSRTGGVNKKIEGSENGDDGGGGVAVATAAPSPSPSKEEEEEERIAQAETSAVRTLKVMVLAVLAFSTAAVSALVYLYARHNESALFRARFDEDARKIFSSIGTNLDNQFGAMDVFATSMVSYAKATNQTFPFVTMDDFELRAGKVRSLTDIIQIVFYPLVLNHQRLQWEAYSIENGGWVNQSLNIQETEKNYYGPIDYNYENYGVVFSDYGDVPYNVSRDYMPTWQQSPAIPTPDWPAFNWDLLSMVGEISLDISYGVLESGKARMNTFMLPNRSNAEEVAIYDSWLLFWKDYVKPGDDSGEPMGEIYFPVINILETATIQSVNESQVVGILNFLFYWRDLIRDILPSDSKGIIVVFHNPCKPSFTYEVNGAATAYVGQEDLHDKKYNQMGMTSMIHDLEKYSISRSTYSGPAIEEDYCPMTINIYPSATMESQFRTVNPIIFTAITVFVFAFTCTVFLFYDWMVERRQSKVMHTALRSTAIVSSLFPKQVQDRLFHNHESSSYTSKTTLNCLSIKSGNSVEQDAESDSKSCSPPIADLFPECTVFFADIAGFTAWSSSRDPTQVFTLLETLYAAFDKIAKRRRIFKVGTIGDCYVAVCGLPEPRQEHAVVMARFAAECRHQMMEKAKLLENTLGPETFELKLRIGLHSGPVTAGVLRGDRARFELFGDTVNTASRMESNGMPNKIHCSDKTAEKLRESGKDNWLAMREEMVVVKGKGKMQTYWVEPMLRDYNASSTSSIFPESSGRDNISSISSVSLPESFGREEDYDILQGYMLPVGNISTRPVTPLVERV